MLHDGVFKVVLEKGLFGQAAKEGGVVLHLLSRAWRLFSKTELGDELVLGPAVVVQTLVFGVDCRNVENRAVLLMD
jgi:hypothetical protein